MPLDYEKIQAVHGVLAEVTQGIDAAGHAVADRNVCEAVEVLEKSKIGIDRAIEEMGGNG